MAGLDPEQLQLRLWLDNTEKVLRKKIRESDAPFLGLLGELFTAQMRQMILRALSSSPTVKGYIRRLETHPALFAVNLAWHVMQGMGQEGHFSLYPHVREALGIGREPSQTERELLWSAFRRAVIYLGLEPSPRISGPHYMAEEYLRQAGVPLAFVDDLAKRMLSFARKVGLPDDDDPEGTISWQLELDNRLEPPFSQTARKALAYDRQGYYTRIFLRVHATGGQPTEEANKLGQAMARAFQKEGATTFRRAALPHVLFRDGCMGVFFPGGDEREWLVEVDGTSRQYRTGAEDRFFPISKALPGVVTVRNRGTGQKVQTTLWEDEKPNRLLLFAENGRLAGRGQLGQNETIALPPGAYTVLARFQPVGVEADELLDEPRLLSFPLLLRPEENRIFQNGPARVEIQAGSQPLIRWKGQSHTGKEGVEFLFGVVDLEVEIPNDWLATGAEYVLALFSGERGDVWVTPLQPDKSGRAHIGISELVRQAGWKPGLMRLLVELRRKGESRALLRSAALFWQGLSEINRDLRFHCTLWPENLKLEFSENIERSGNDLRLKDGAMRSVRLVFALSEKRQQSLSWNVPGVFVEVEDVTEGGGAQRVRRALGSTEAVSLASAKQIVVIASDPGILRLGDWSARINFARRSTRVLPAGFLASRLTPRSNTLIYEDEATGRALNLLRLTQPHAVERFSSQVQGSQLVIRVQVLGPLEALAVRTLDLLSGIEDSVSLPANASEWTKARFGQARLMVLEESHGRYTAHLYINLEYWPTGGWLFYLDGQIRGVWGHLQNSREDVFAAGLLLSEGGQVISRQEWLDRVAILDDEAACRLFERIHTALLTCYAQEAWENLDWLAATWKALTGRWEGQETQALTTLVDLASSRPPEDASASWVPQLAVGAALPALFALSAKEYRRVNEKAHPIARALRAMAEVEKRWPAVFPDLLHQCAAAGFENLRDITRGASPRGFDLSRYIAALTQVDAYSYLYRLGEESYLPGAGDYLGPLHYRHASRALESSYERTLAGNDVWRGQAIGLAQYVSRIIPKLVGPGIPKALLGQPPHLTPWTPDPDAAVPDELLQQRENLANISHLLASFAFACRLEARMPGTLKSYLKQLRASSIPLGGPLAFLLQIGEALFAYYLLLWELVLMADSGGVIHERS